jgi:hypothetical protein
VAEQTVPANRRERRARGAGHAERALGPRHLEVGQTLLTLAAIDSVVPDHAGAAALADEDSSSEEARTSARPGDHHRHLRPLLRAKIPSSCSSVRRLARSPFSKPSSVGHPAVAEDCPARLRTRQRKRRAGSSVRARGAHQEEGLLPDDPGLGDAALGTGETRRAAITGAREALERALREGLDRRTEVGWTLHHLAFCSPTWGTTTNDPPLRALSRGAGRRRWGRNYFYLNAVLISNDAGARASSSARWPSSSGRGRGSRRAIGRP